MAREQRSLVKQVAQLNLRLARHQQRRDEIKGQIYLLEDEEALLSAAIRERLQAGAREEAKSRAETLYSVQQQLQDLRPRLEQAEAVCTSLVETRDAAITPAREKLEKLSSDLVELQRVRERARVADVTRQERDKAIHEGRLVDKPQTGSNPADAMPVLPQNLEEEA